MQLWERGKLDLDAPVQKYCPAFPQKRWPITTRELPGILAESGIIACLNFPTLCPKLTPKWATHIILKMES